MDILGFGRRGVAALTLSLLLVPFAVAGATEMPDPGSDTTPAVTPSTVAEAPSTTQAPSTTEAPAVTVTTAPVAPPPTDPLAEAPDPTVAAVPPTLAAPADVPTGSLDVQKVVKGNADPTATFTIVVDCDGDADDQTLEFDSTGTLTSGSTPMDGLSAGTMCTVTETVSSGAHRVAYSLGDGGHDDHDHAWVEAHDDDGSSDPPTVTIVEDETITVTVTNHMGKPKGTIDVVKVVAGNGTPAPGTTFTVDIDCNGNGHDATLVFDAAGSLVSGTNPHKAPDGQTCTVTETATGGASTVTYDPNGGTPGSAPAVKMVADQQITVTITNAYVVPMGSVAVVKVIGDGPEPPEDAEFAVAVDCDHRASVTMLRFDATGTLVAGTSPITDVPAGTTCTVTETATGGASGVTYEPHGATGSDPPTVTVVEGEVATVTVTNTFPPSPAAAAIAAASGSDVDDRVVGLARTGSEVHGLVLVATALLLGGFAAIALRRRLSLADGPGLGRPNSPPATRPGEDHRPSGTPQEEPS